MARDYTLLIKQTLVCLRKDLSQEQVNRKLRFTTNQVARWESGHAKINWHSFYLLAKATKAPLKGALKHHLFFDGAPEDEKSLVHFLTHFYTQKELAKKLNVSSSFVSKLISGKSSLSFETFLKIVDNGPYSLVNFLAELTAPQIPLLIQQEEARLSQEKEFHFANPWVASLLLFMNTVEYQALKKHSDLFLSLKLGLPEKMVAEAMAHLLALDLLEKRGAVFQPRNLHLHTGGNFSGALSLRRYWLNYCLNELEHARPGQNNFFGYKVFNISVTEQKKIEEIYLRFFGEVEKLVKDSTEPSERVYLLAAQMLDLDQTLRPAK